MNCWPVRGGRGLRAVFMTEIRAYPDRGLLMQAAAEHVVSVYESAALSGSFSIVLAGGSTPRQLYQLLAEAHFAGHVDWSLVHVFWGDERCVPPDHEDSNYRMARLALLDHVQLPAGNIYRMRGEGDPQQAAVDYEKRLRAFFGEDAVRFDLVLLGMGDDGHTASLFPGTAALDETERLVVANHVPQQDSWRLTLTYPAINNAANVTFLVAGADKAEALRDVLEGPPDQYPAQRVQPVNGSLLWLVDDAAAAQLENDP